MFGEIEIAVKVGAVIVNMALPEMLPEVAMIIGDPAATPVARPTELTVASELLLDDHVTVFVQLVLVPLL